MSPDLERLQDEMSEAIQVFEPRITPRSLVIHADMERNVVSFDVAGELWGQPASGTFAPQDHSGPRNRTVPPRRRAP